MKAFHHVVVLCPLVLVANFPMEKSLQCLSLPNIKYIRDKVKFHNPGACCVLMAL